MTGRCWLLRNAGACKPADFGIEIFTRSIESERQCTALAPGLDNPVCLGMPATIDDSRVFSYADAEASAAAIPFPDFPAPGAGALPLPCADYLNASKPLYLPY